MVPINNMLFLTSKKSISSHKVSVLSTVEPDKNNTIQKRHIVHIHVSMGLK